MYWFKPCFKIIALGCGIFVLCGWYACKPEIKETGATLAYFDLKDYFRADSARLTRLNQPVIKTVSHNGDTETKKVHIANWGQELNLFKESDINKPAWKASYTIQKAGDSLVYTAKYPELKTRRISIHKDIADKVTSIYIYNKSENILYSTSEKLTYIPGAYYLIEKDQHVKVIGENDYKIKGVF
ncbi:hypothetical protein [Mucilaginibacter segetis]|uniref:Uncharacterized protein n=1 Tax=Mucilaginibacter segetis TaxID=2793071 RepID=A0A934UL84_9SPHI|nr:hypothetical protein [Mucilaginibacter segetis]MBK0378263.1 hypothetical protein [Mucilaginibacter segetis]